MVYPAFQNPKDKKNQFASNRLNQVRSVLDSKPDQKNQVARDQMAPPVDDKNQIAKARVQAINTKEGLPTRNGPAPVAPATPVARPPITDKNNVPAPPQTTGAREQSFIDQLLKNGQSGGNTEEMDALLHQLFGDQAGQQLVDQRASMGRAGFGSSGALGAMEGDTMRKNAQAEAQARIGFDTQENQRSIDNALHAIGADVSLKGADLDAAREKISERAQALAETGMDDQHALTQALIDLFGAEAGGGDSDAPKNPSVPGQTNFKTPAGGGERFKTELPTANIQDGRYKEGDPYQGSDSEYDYYASMGPDGATDAYRVRQHANEPADRQTSDHKYFESHGWSLKETKPDGTEVWVDQQGTEHEVKFS